MVKSFYNVELDRMHQLRSPTATDLFQRSQLDFQYI